MVRAANGENMAAAAAPAASKRMAKNISVKRRSGKIMAASWRRRKARSGQYGEKYGGGIGRRREAKAA